MTSVHPSVRTSIRTFVRASCVRPSVRPSVRTTVLTSVRTSIRPTVRPSVMSSPLSVRQSGRPSVRPYVRLSVRPYVRLSVSTSVCLYVHPYVHPYVRPYVRPSVRSYVGLYVRPSCPSVTSVRHVCPLRPSVTFVHAFVRASVRTSSRMSRYTPVCQYIFLSRFNSLSFCCSFAGAALSLCHICFVEASSSVCICLFVCLSGYLSVFVPCVCCKTWWRKAYWGEDVILVAVCVEVDHLNLDASSVP